MVALVNGRGISYVLQTTEAPKVWNVNFTVLCSHELKNKNWILNRVKAPKSQKSYFKDMYVNSLWAKSIFGFSLKSQNHKHESTAYQKSNGREYFTSSRKQNNPNKLVYYSFCRVQLLLKTCETTTNSELIGEIGSSYKKFQFQFEFSFVVTAVTIFIETFGKDVLFLNNTVFGNQSIFMVQWFVCFWKAEFMKNKDT